MKDGCFKGMSGAYAAMFTPIGKDDRVNEEAIEEIVECGVANGLRGFRLMGDTSTDVSVAKAGQARKRGHR